MRRVSFYKIFCLLFTFFYIINASAQLPDHEWAKQFGSGGAILGEPKTILSDAEGNVYVAGSFSGTNDFDPGAGVHNLTSMKGSDIFIMKLDTSGSLVWVQQISGERDDMLIQCHSIKLVI